MDGCSGIGGGGVDDVFGAEFASHVELGVGDVDGDDFGPGDGGVLDGEVTEPADTEHGDACGRSRTGPFTAL